MKLIDTHSHLYEPEFDDDREAAVARAREAGVAALLLPAIDTASDRRLFDLCRSHPEYCFPMIGLHPTSVNDNPAWREELARVERYLLDPPAGIRFCAIGEIGLDYYWSDAFVAQQTEAFVAQLRLAARFDLPVAIHTRAAWDDMCRIIEAETERARADGRRLRGVFHAFSEGAAAFERLCGCGDFRFGIGGTVTFKKSGVAEIVRTMPLDRIVLETDCRHFFPHHFGNGILPHVIKHHVHDIHFIPVQRRDDGQRRSAVRHPLHGKEYRTTMKKIKITVVRKVCHRDLIERYENPIDHACDMREGQVFVADGWQRPDGLCESAWQTISPFVMTLAHGGTDLYDGWMKNPASAMISCNDGFRSVSFLIETLD